MKMPEGPGLYFSTRRDGQEARAGVELGRGLSCVPCVTWASSVTFLLSEPQFVHVQNGVILAPSF